MQFNKLAGILAMATGLAEAASTFSPARPPAIPLAVKSPYLSTWLFAGSDGGNGGYLAGQWQSHWAQTTTAMAGFIRVDGTAYEFAGNPTQRTPGPATVDQTAFSYTATRSVFTQTAGPVQITTTFLSPINPHDMERASLIASYVNVAVSSTDGGTHDVQVYMDVSGEWASGDDSSVITWDYGTSGDAAYHSFARQTPLLFSQISDKAEWGTWYWSSDNDSGMSYQSGADTTVRQQFVNNGTLTNSQDTNFRAISDDWPVFGFAHDLGAVDATAKDALFTIGLYQQEAIQFIGDGDSTQIIPSLWTTYFSDEPAAVSFFHDDYSTASSDADTWDSKITSDATTAGGSDYATITTLAARQAFASIQLTGNATKQYIFLKEISSDGNVNTVDVIYPAMPIFLYTNATYMKLMLDPLFENQEAGHYPNMYSMHDLGASYPNATGHPDGNDEYMPLEECGNMLVMTLAYAQKAQDTAYLTQHYNILKQWTEYLVQEALYPANQISTDDFAGALPNQTNLAIKGMIGIAAMGQIANLTGNSADASNYSSTAASYISTWQSLAINTAASPPHSVINYNAPDTWGTLYNLYADRLLNLNVVPQTVYDTVNAFYPTVMKTYGLPLDYRDALAKGDWEMFMAAALPAGDTKTMLINKLATWIGVTPTNLPLTDLYATDSGDWPDDGAHFAARPVVGGMFALLALM